jgi:general secretion pathway protein D
MVGVVVFRTRLACGLLAALLVLLPFCASSESLTLNFKDADIGAVIQTVSDITGKNFIVDPRVKGKVTVISSTPLRPDEVYEVFLAVLNVHGFAVVPGPSASKIVPEVNAKQSEIPNVSAGHPGRDDEYVTRVIPVKHVAAAQLVPILRPLLPQQGHLAAFPQSNMLVASATAANIKRLVQLIHRIDVVSDGDVEVIGLQHASAEELVRILTSLDQGGAKGQAGAPQVKMVADLRTNSILLRGEKSERLRMRALISHLDTPLEEAGNTQVVYLRYADAKDLVPVLTGVSSSIPSAQQKGQAAAATAAKGAISIQADEATNALVINAPPDVMRSLEAVIRKLDVRRAQVMVEALIAEVSLDTAKELGIQWIYDGSPNNAPVGIINFSGSGAGLTDILVNKVIPDGVTLGVGDTEGNGGARGGAVLRALAADANTNILSTPTLVTMDNEEAEIVVGQNVPFITGSYTSTGTGSTPQTPFQTIERKDVGLTLKVKPQINEGNAIKLNIAQEVSSLASSVTGAADVVTNKRSIKSTVMVDDGQVVVLGGLIDDQLQESIQKVPGLGDIPALGWLFSYKKTTKVKRDLMVFLRPVILRDASEDAAVSGEKYNYMRARQLETRERGVALMSSDAVPVLPAMRDWLRLPPPFEGIRQRGGGAPGGAPDAAGSR